MTESLEAKDMESQYLLVQTNEPTARSDGSLINKQRLFFTKKKNFRYLIAFAKCFGADLIIVKSVGPKVLGIKEFVDAVNNPEYSDSTPFTILSKRIVNSYIVEKKKSIRRRCSSEAKPIINSFLRSRSQFRFRDLKNHITTVSISDSTLRRYFKSAVNDLRKSGYKVKHVRCKWLVSQP